MKKRLCKKFAKRLERHLFTNLQELFKTEQMDRERMMNYLRRWGGTNVRPDPDDARAIQCDVRVPAHTVIVGEVDA